VSQLALAVGLASQFRGGMMSNLLPLLLLLQLLGRALL